MKITKRQLRRIIREEAEGRIDVAEPSDVEPIEDVWAGGEESLVDPIDFVSADTDGSVSNVVEPEVMRITAEVRKRIRLKRFLREQLEAAGVEVEEEIPADVDAVVEPEVMPEPAVEEEERAGASISSLRSFFSGKAAEVNDLGISDPQIPALVAAINDLIGQAQSGTLSSREDRVRKGITKA
tara:strand:- start:1357 stop:1905 length:549 start_codon:yes stop_codon:yes gene_type:complete